MASTPSPKRSPKGSTSPSSLIHKRRDSQLLAIDQIQQGFPVWVQNPYEEGSNSHYRANQLPAAVCTRPTWVPAIVQSVDAKSGIISVKTTYVPPMILKLGRAEIWARNNTKTTLDDMVYFKHLHEAAIVNNIRARYEAESIYTRAGEILIVMNPYKLCRDKHGISIYDEVYMKQYRVTNSGIGNVLAPHIFEVANRAYMRLREEHKPQSVVISGESGAGKTETTKQIMQFVANLSNLTENLSQDRPRGASQAMLEQKELAIARRRSTRRRGSLGGPGNKFEVSDKAIIEQQLLQSNPILESFGNSKTMRNNNSSRFGKYLKIFFDDTRIVGGSITNYLLEKSRVFSQLPNERSYHVFYQILRGADDSMKSELGLQRPEDYSILTDSKSHLVRDAYMGGEGSSDQADFHAVQHAMHVCGFSESNISDIWSIVAGVMSLGNVHFDEVEDGNASSGHRATGPTKASITFFDNAVRVLGLDPGTLGDALTHRYLQVAGSTQRLAQDAAKARENVVAMSGSLYSWLFTAIVRLVNEGIRTSVEKELGIKNDPENNLFIGILDIFGFEVFDDENGFEQLLINYANERLHNFFIQYVFKLEEAKYKAEHIDYSNVSFTDNQLVIDLIHKKGTDGIFQQLASASMFGKLTDVKLLEKMTTTFRKKNGANETGSLFTSKAPRFPDKFVVRHSANDVEYTITGFLKKNKDHLPAHLSDALGTSKLALIQAILKSKTARAATPASSSPMRGGAGGARSTLGGSNVMLSLRFGDNISALMKTMQTTNPLFVRCIKSNEHKRPFFFDSAKVFHQLRYLGVLDSIRIRHEGYSYQESFKAFYDYFVVVVHQNPQYGMVLVPPEGSDFRALAEKLGAIMWKWIKEKEFGASAKLSDHFQVGTSHVFIRKQLARSFDVLRSKLLVTMDEAARKIQSVWLMYTVKKKVNIFKRELIHIQCAFRGRFYRKAWMQRRKTVQTLQWFARGYLLKKRYKYTLLPAIRVLQRFTRRTRDRLAWFRIRRGIRILHRLSRGFIVRRHVLKMLFAVKTIQRGMRSFLRRNKIYWEKVKGALYVQSLWRSYSCRKRREDVIDFLALKRRNRKVKLCIKRLQASWKATLVWRRYQQLKGGAVVLQVWARSRLTRFRFRRIQRETRMLQRCARGMLARCRVRRLRTANLLADEMWRVKVVREREILHLAKMTSAPADSFTPSSSQIVGSGHRKRPTYHAGVLDVDITEDCSDIYPRGWSKSLTELREQLGRNNRCLVSVAIGAQHTLAVDSNGDIYSWGWGDMGQLGTGTYANEIMPRLINPFTHQLASGRNLNGGKIARRVMIQTIACGEDHSVILAEDGSVYTWGSNSRGQLGHGPSNQTSCSPRKVQSFKRPVTEISCGSYHNICLLVSGNVAVWGNGDVLGLGVFVENDDQATPVMMQSLSTLRIRSINAGPDYNMAVTHGGDMYSWGLNYAGQLGVGDKKSRIVPTLNLPMREDVKNGRVVKLACGLHHALALTSTGRVYAWGGNECGQLGIGDFKERLTPVRLSKLHNFHIVGIAAGGRQSIVLSDDHKIMGWGVCGAVVGGVKTSEYDPDVDNTVFLSKVPQEIPFNTGVGRNPRGVAIQSSSLLSVATLMYHQRAVDAATASQPLLTRRTSTAMEAKRMTLNTVRGRLSLSVEDQDNHENTLIKTGSLKSSPVKSDKSSANPRRISPSKAAKADKPYYLGGRSKTSPSYSKEKTVSSPSNVHMLSPEQLKLLSNDQLRELVLELQVSTQGETNIDMDDVEPSVVDMNLTHPGYATIYRGEKHRSPIAKAKEKAWDSHFFNSGSVLQKGVRVTSPPKLKHPFQRRVSTEHHARTEMLIDFSKDLKRKTSPKKKPWEKNDSVVTAAMATPLSVIERNKSLEDKKVEAARLRQEEHKRLEEVKKRRRHEREGRPDSMVNLFTSEQLVATSNDELDLAAVIEQKLQRGQQPSLPLRSKQSSARIENTKSAHTSPRGMSGTARMRTYSQALHDGKLSIGFILGEEGQTMMQAKQQQYNAMYDRPNKSVPKKRDVVEIFRSVSKRESKSQMEVQGDQEAGLVRKSVQWENYSDQMQSARKREIEENILGESGAASFVSSQTPVKRSNVSRMQRSMSYIALEKEVDSLRNELFGGNRK